MVVSGKVRGIDSEGSVSVRTLGRVDVRAIQATPDMMTADVEARSGEQDLDAEEAKLRFDKLRTSMLKFIQRFQWESGRGVMFCIGKMCPKSSRLCLHI